MYSALIGFGLAVISLTLFAGPALGESSASAIRESIRRNSEELDQVYLKYNKKFMELGEQHGKRFRKALDEGKPIPAHPLVELGEINREVSREVLALRSEQASRRFKQEEAIEKRRLRAKNSKITSADSSDPADVLSPSTSAPPSSIVKPASRPRESYAPRESPKISGEHVPQSLDFSSGGGASNKGGP